MANRGNGSRMMQGMSVLSSSGPWRHAMSQNSFKEQKREKKTFPSGGTWQMSPYPGVDTVLDKHPRQGTAGGVPTCTLLVMRKASSEPKLGILYEQTDQFSTKNLGEENQGTSRNHYGPEEMMETCHRTGETSYPVCHSLLDPRTEWGDWSPWADQLSFSVFTSSLC